MPPCESSLSCDFNVIYLRIKTCASLAMTRLLIFFSFFISRMCVHACGLLLTDALICLQVSICVEGPPPTEHHMNSLADRPRLRRKVKHILIATMLCCGKRKVILAYAHAHYILVPAALHKNCFFA